MSFIVSPPEISENNRNEVGGKAFSLAMMVRKGVRIPDFVCVTVQAYKEYVSSTGLAPRILFELNRKNFADMRWEEIWDASLRIRNLFLNTPIPPKMNTTMVDIIEQRFIEKPVVVRSSSPGEDASTISFAGLHESFVNVTGVNSIMDHIRLVWASLWSDRALLYRKELGLDVDNSSMAVVVQELLLGGRSGVTFTINPVDSSQSVVEAVYGLNQGLVDGTVEPDRWILERATGRIISHHAATRDWIMAPSQAGVALIQLSEEKMASPPLSTGDVKKVFLMAKGCEGLFRSPQDVEFSFRDMTLYILQSRPITTASSGIKTDLRPWYLSLTRSFENLKMLHTKIEYEILPSMDKEAMQLAAMDLRIVGNEDLSGEIDWRNQVNDKWLKTYDDYCIPFAHGMRLFGQAYNDVIRPADPYEFMDLLRAERMASLERNRLLSDLASMIREAPEIKAKLTKGLMPQSVVFRERLNSFHDAFGESVSRGLKKINTNEKNRLLIPLLLEMADRSPSGEDKKFKTVTTLEKRFFSQFAKEKRGFARELLDLGRASYRLRDDDNIYLGRIEAQLLKAVNEGKKRLYKRGISFADRLDSKEVIAALKDSGYIPPKPINTMAATRRKKASRIKARQLVGQPAGPGIATGLAHVILSPDDLFQFKTGEVLICDAVDPNMTFVVPLASGIVERRGGMLIHGAIIAREYGLPCVTGIPDVTSLVKTGDQLTVDGYLGIVIIG